MENILDDLILVKKEFVYSKKNEVLFSLYTWLVFTNGNSLFIFFILDIATKHKHLLKCQKCPASYVLFRSHLTSLLMSPSRAHTIRGQVYS